MPLGMDFGGEPLAVGPGDIVLDWMGTQPPKGVQSPNFRPMHVVVKRLEGSRYGTW